jgi:hypothetical protein
MLFDCRVFRASGPLPELNGVDPFSEGRYSPLRFLAYPLESVVSRRLYVQEICMNRKSVLFGIGVGLLAIGVATVLTLLLLHEPAVYARTGLPAGPERQQLSGEFNSEFVHLYDGIRNESIWDATFTEKSINSYFEEGFVSQGVAKNVLPEGVSAPRVAIEPDKIRLAFRYSLGPWSTIITVDMRVWLANKREPNVIALELQGLHAGSLPIAAQSLLEQISETARQNGIKVIWYRYHGNPVALLKFQADQPHPTIQFLSLKLDAGQLFISGRAIDADRAVLERIPAAEDVTIAAN